MVLVRTKRIRTYLLFSGSYLIIELVDGHEGKILKGGLKTIGYIYYGVSPTTKFSSRWKRLHLHLQFGRKGYLLPFQWRVFAGQLYWVRNII